MPPRKKTTEETPSDQEQASEVKAGDASTKSVESPEKTSLKKNKLKEDNDSGQLFFSTDGSEPDKEERNPYLDEGKEEKPPAQPKEKPEPASEKTATEEKKEEGGPRAAQGNKPNRGPHPHPQKKQNWQDKKKQRNKQRQKFKKPKRLPYEETETKPLELGDLQENESLQSLDGITALAEDFNSSDQKPIELDELLALSLQELKEKVVSFELDLGQAPLRKKLLMPCWLNAWRTRLLF
jgi:hypothetical protein